MAQRSAGRDLGRGCLAVGLTVLILGGGLWAFLWVTAFDRTTSDDIPEWADRAEWLGYQELPSATFTPPAGGAGADDGVVFSKWTKANLMSRPSVRTFHIVARVPPDSLDVWHERAWGWTADGRLERGLPPNPSPDPGWLTTLPPGPPTDGISEWYGDRRDMVGLDRARGIVAYRSSTFDEHREAKWWWRFWDR